MGPIGFRTRSKLMVQDAAKFEPDLDPVWLWNTAYGDRAVESARQVLAAGAWEHLEVEWLYAKPACWTKTSDKMPASGQLIVKRWANGSVWAGVYNGGPKEGSFDEWKAL